MTTTPRRPGRPAGIRTDRDDMVRVRVNAEQRAAFEGIGGSDWLRTQLDRFARQTKRRALDGAKENGNGS